MEGSKTMTDFMNDKKQEAFDDKRQELFENKRQEAFDDEKQNFFDDGTIIMLEKTPDAPEEKMSKELVVYHASPRRRIWGWIVAAIIVALLLVIVALQLKSAQPEKTDIQEEVVLPTSATAEKNTQKLQEEAPKVSVKSGVTELTDTINDVQLKLYSMEGVHAELSLEEPAADDEEVYLYTNCADVRADNGKVVCAFVMKGELLSTGNNRSGYFAAVGDNTVIGVEYNDSIQNYVMENGGYFFRQFALISAGQIGDIRLKGKVGRCALGMKDGKLFYIESVNRESMYDFAEALCDYGFTDAIYITGGKRHRYYRDEKGVKHEMGPLPADIGDNAAAEEPPLPFLIFKKN